MSKTKLISSISTPRLSSYCKVFGCSDEASALHYYFWNQAVSSGLYILLHNIEVCLRNQVHQELSKEVSFLNTKTMQDSYAWYDHLNFVEIGKDGLVKKDRNGNDVLTETGKAFRKITHKGTRNLNLLPQIIVSRLEFGKWSYVLSAKKYGDGSTIDWDKLYPLIFPGFNGMDPSKHHVIVERIRTINLWRNRVAHLEPVWKFGDIKQGAKVVLGEPKNKDEVLKRFNAELRRTVQLLEWLCEDTYNYYIQTRSYANLRHLITAEGIDEFSL